MSLVVARLTRGNYLLVTLVTCELGEDVHVRVYCILYIVYCIPSIVYHIPSTGESITLNIQIHQLSLPPL